MRRFKTLIALVAVVVISCLAVGCIGGLKSLKRTSEKAEPSPESGGLAKPRIAENSNGSKPKPADDLAPVYAPPPPPPSKESKEKAAADLGLRDEIEASALEFAKNFPNVQHVKICYSKLYGGWYLFLYIEKGKKRSLHHYAWNPRSSEWEIIETFKEDRIPKTQWKFHLKGELPGEKCYILK